MDIRLRPYRAEDRAFIYELKKRCYLPFVSAVWGWDEDAQQAYFERFIRRAADGLWVILLGEAPIGMVNWSVPDARTWELENVCLLPEHRGKGIGTQVLGGLIAGCGYPCAVLRVFKDNPAVRLYERLGFVPAGETRHHVQMRLERA